MLKKTIPDPSEPYTGNLKFYKFSYNLRFQINLQTKSSAKKYYRYSRQKEEHLGYQIEAYFTVSWAPKGLILDKISKCLFSEIWIEWGKINNCGVYHTNIHIWIWISCLGSNEPCAVIAWPLPTYRQAPTVKSLEVDIRKYGGFLSQGLNLRQRALTRLSYNSTKFPPHKHKQFTVKSVFSGHQGDQKLVAV
jgi:hypothetical protein